MPGEDDNIQIINGLRNNLGAQFNPEAGVFPAGPNPLALLENTNLEAQYLPYLSSDKIIIIENLQSTRYNDSINNKFDITDSPIGASQIQQSTKKALLTFLDDRQQIRENLGISPIETQQQFFIVRDNNHWEVFQYDPPSGATNQQPKITHFNIKGDGMCGVTSAIKVAQLLDPNNQQLQNLTEHVSSNFTNYERKPSTESAVPATYLPENTAPFYHLKKARLPADTLGQIKYSFYDLDTGTKNFLTQNYETANSSSLNDLLSNPTDGNRQFNVEKICQLLSNIYRTDPSNTPSIFSYESNNGIVANKEIPSELNVGEFPQFLNKSKIFHKLIKYQEIKDVTPTREAEKEDFYNFLASDTLNLRDLLIHELGSQSDLFNKKFLYHLASAYLDALEHFDQKHDVTKFNKIKTNLESLTPTIKQLIPNYDFDPSYLINPTFPATSAPASPVIASLAPIVIATEEPEEPRLPHPTSPRSIASTDSEIAPPTTTSTPAPSTHPSPRGAIANGITRLRYREFEKIETKDLANYFKNILRKGPTENITSQDLETYLPDYYKPVPQTYKGFGFSFEVTADSLKIDGVADDSNYKSMEGNFLNKEITKINNKSIADHFQSAKNQNIDPKYYFAHLIRERKNLFIEFKNDRGKDTRMSFTKENKKHFSVDTSAPELKISEEKDPQKIAKTDNPAYVLDFRNALFEHIDLKFEELDAYLKNPAEQDRKIKFPGVELLSGDFYLTMGSGLAKGQWYEFETGIKATKGETTQNCEDMQNYLHKKVEELRANNEGKIEIGTVGNYSKDGTNLNPDYNDASKKTLNVWSANDGNFNIANGKTIPGGNQAACMGARNAKNFGIITTPYTLSKKDIEDALFQKILQPDQLISPKTTHQASASRAVSGAGVFGHH